MRPMLLRTAPALPFLALATTLAAQEPADFDLDAAFAAAQPTADEARWTLVPWRTSLTDALDEAKRTGKPIYLYVNDGDVETGRC